jgi:hypothetical protein
MENRAEFTKGIADTLSVILKMEIPDKDSHQLTPGVLAKLLHRQQHNPREFASYDFTETISMAIGKVMIDEIPNLLDLVNRMEAKGYTGDNWYDFGYIDKYCVLLLNTEVRKAIAFRTQNVNYLVFLRHSYNGWELHLRRFYEELDEEELQELTENYEPTPAGIMYLAERCTTYFSDDVPGHSYPHRLSLNSFVRTGFRAGDDQACSGLRYLDIRDTGYLASATNKWFDEPSCEKVTSIDMGTLQYVWYDLICSTRLDADDVQEA